MICRGFEEEYRNFVNEASYVVILIDRSLYEEWFDKKEGNISNFKMRKFVFILLVLDIFIVFITY